MSGVNPTLWVITLNVNRLSTLIKMQKLAEWVKKNMIQLYTGYNRNTLDSKSQISWKLKNGKTMQATQKRAGVTYSNTRQNIL